MTDDDIIERERRQAVVDLLGTLIAEHRLNRDAPLGAWADRIITVVRS